jgi:hypothetical protein
VTAAAMSRNAYVGQSLRRGEDIKFFTGIGRLCRRQRLASGALGGVSVPAAVAVQSRAVV